ncbi:MAG: hypothetical protein AABX54_03965 [Nanoarchaeota archaeon]
MKLLNKKNAGIVVVALSSAILGSLVTVVATDPNIRLIILIFALIGIVVGTIASEK